MMRVMVTAPRKTVMRARQLRKAMSLPEILLWRILKARHDGLKFRKQHPIGPYILDFFCFERSIAIEIDGQSHDMGDRPERDVARDAWLAARRIKVIRIAAKDVLADAETVAQSLIDYIKVGA